MTYTCEQLKDLLELVKDGCKSQECGPCVFSLTCAWLYQKANLSVKFEDKTRELAKKRIEQIICGESNES